MASRTSTETRREISRKGDVVIVKEVETTTTYVPGKEPDVKEVTRVEEFKGEEGFKRLPEDIRRQLDISKDEKPVRPTNKTATRGKFAEECLSEHNKYRKMHGVDPLKLSKQLMHISEQRAKELADRDEMISRTDQSYGENMSCLHSNDPEHVVQPAEIVSRWYSEHKNYDFNVEPTNLSAGHFTQMIWGGTKEFGIAAAKSDTNKIYVVATYSPPGNFVGQFRHNVHPSGAKVGKGTKSFLGFKFSSSSSGPKQEDDKNASQLNKDCVAIHNEYRKKHGVPPLKYSKELAKYAQEWADELARLDKFEHRKERKYGENLYSFRSTNPQALATPADACKSWYSEIQKYDFNIEPKSLNAGHFTQMVWKGTSEVGMGRAKSKSGLQIIVANYNPPGNYVGNYRENVPKPVDR